MTRIFEAIDYLKSLGIEDPTGEQITAYESYALENFKDRNNKYSIIYNKISFYKKIRLHNRCERLSGQINHINECKRDNRRYRNPERTLKVLGGKILEEVCRHQERATSYLAYLATGDKRFGKIPLIELHWKPGTDYHYSRFLDIEEATEVLEKCYNLDAIKLEDITLGTPIKTIPRLQKTRKGYELARSFGRAIETSNWWENKGGEINEKYRKQIRPYHSDSHQYWQDPWPYNWPTQYAKSEFIIRKELKGGEEK